jgi:hypothetical protein
MKSTDKGLTWALINTPLTSIDNMSFDFKDVNKGLLSDYNYYTKTALLYSTTNGGASWSLIKSSTSENYSNLRYIPSQNAYTSISRGGYIQTSVSYSTDNGLTWIKNTSFQNMFLGQISSTPSGKLFLGGDSYIYSSTSISGVNISVAGSKIAGLNSIDITYSANPDPVISQTLANYSVSYMKNKVPVSLGIQSIALDATNKSIIHIKMQSDLPLDTIMVNLGDIKDSNGVSVLNKDIVFYNTSKTIKVNTAGTLLSLMSTDELANITNLTLTGTIDARDFKTMRDNMPGLRTLDLSGATVAEYNGTEGTYSTAVTDYPAGATPRQAFYTNTSLTSIVLPSTLTAIGRSSFNVCTGLTSINIPSTVTAIGYYAFYGCSRLASVTLLTGLTLIDYSAFGNCSLLNSVSIPSTVNTIGDLAFYNCTNLALVNISPLSSLSTIGSETFENCPLTSFSVPSSVTSIGSYAFLGSKALITVDAANPTYSSADGVLFDKIKTKLIYVPFVKTGAYEIPPTVSDIGSDAFYNCYSLTAIKIPTSVTTIEDWAFESCSGLSSILIPSSVNVIMSDAFYGCSSLTSIYSNAVTPVDLSLSDSVFEYVNKSTCTLYVPIGSKVSYQMAVEWEDFTNIVEFSTSLTDFSKVKLGLIGNSYYLNNAVGGAIAQWDICWKDSANNIQAYVPVVTGNGKIFTWSFPAVILNGSNTGMFKFCFPKSDNTPDWTQTPIGYTQTNDYTGDASTDIDRTSDSGGAFTLQNSGMLKKYDLKLIIDQTYGFNMTTLDVNGFGPIYFVKVPVGTKACYIAGTMNNWTQQAMNKLNATDFTLNIPTATATDTYKYCSGPTWAYVEKDASGNDISNRSYSTTDVVANWALVYSDVKNINSNNVKLMSGKSFIRAEFDGNARVEVYNLSGVMLKQANATNTITVNNLNTGLYIVKINGTAYKVLVQ